MAVRTVSLKGNIKVEKGVNKRQPILENGLEDRGRGKGKLGQSERVACTYIHYQT